MRRLNWQRFTLALVCTVGVGVALVLAFFYAANLSAVSVGLITLAIRELGGGKAAAFSWFFDGSADKPPPSATTTISTPDPTKPASLTAKPAALPTTYPIDVPKEAYDRLIKDGWTDAQLLAANMKPPTKVTS